ncbi:hypothetical protein [Actinokineospora auranticolor]|uniref:hypothetical protein n=1 Tax=Actinokineospora auranticolor TaxID=155976 RepID=UPI0011B07856|nr:hypothetical protein [Actinokineospora auranticolor]
MPIEIADPIALTDLAGSVDDRWAAFEQAATAFAEHVVVDAVPGPPSHQAQSAVVLATLFGPLPTGDLARQLLTSAGVSDPAAVLAWHDTAYPEMSPRDLALNPFRPDRLGEDCVADILAHDRRANEMVAAVLAGISGHKVVDDETTHRHFHRHHIGRYRPLLLRR